ncbi:RsmB/NOP family class I SAM-dependent RNA methyltransferase [Pusillimonas sp. CC-YST705]|uniref:RsmB/NOP family class I SAM-dependent RNA methyltransferase n=1 Tax=Mesopusillimonas faecipullorum TaxID=2755040 RepID=A0ABS8C8I2_9BURK|nr:RsmB/NOP family class I SAM-dependent RNA methyltransferase [Mesopusillimonas faecipullorum]MCB5362164.1 RsmB/NOP family class I SAM-dependent RNA methyltransferase [Mesopusillimonas faecipullorum]
MLDRVLTWEFPADGVLSRWLRENPKLGGRDRAEVAEAVFDVLRHLRQYRHFAQSSPVAHTRCLAILGLASVLPPEKLEAGLALEETQWLQHVQRIDASKLPRAVRWSVPDWLEAKLAMLEDAESLMAALNQPAALDVRINPLKVASRDEMLETLRELSPASEPQATPYSPWGIRLKGRPSVNRWEVFLKGELEVQDEGSQLLAALVAPKRGEMIIDYCAGAGGKTLLIGALMRTTGRLYAFDVSATRLARAKPRFARSGLSNVVSVAIAPRNDQRVRRLHGKAQRVLIDAPCSGLGTLRRSPDLKWRQQPETLEQLRAVQADLLEQAALCLAPGGRLVYATCSVLPEENEAQVEAFLSKHPEFSLQDAGQILSDRCKNLTFEGAFLKLRPDHHQTDGFFAAVLQKAAPEAPAAAVQESEKLDAAQKLI